MAQGQGNTGFERAIADAVAAGVPQEEAERIARAAPPVAPAPPPQRRRAQLAPVPDPAPVFVAPPQNLEAETHVLGAAMIAPAAIAACREVLDPDGGEFYYPSNGLIWRACLALTDTGQPVDAITLANWLKQKGQLEQAGGKARLAELAHVVPASANAAHYARIVAETATMRRLINVGGEVARLGWDEAGDVGAKLEQARELVELATAAPVAVRVRERLIPGGSFILDQPASAASVWGGPDGAIAWAAGEGLMFCGPQGVGKTTLAQQLALARIGLRDEVFGMPVTPDERRVLYLAADRPRQAQRSLARMVTESDRQLLDERLTVHYGPPDLLVDQDARVLVRLAEQAGAGTIVVDSLKDVAAKLTDDETAAKVNLAYQYVVAAGVELVVLHHQRKEQQGAGKPKRLDDVYGNNRLTSGLGSVLLLWGEPGDVLVELTHLKQPADDLGTLQLRHDHGRGATTLVDKPPELDDLLYRAGAAGLAAKAAAPLALLRDEPTRNEVEKIRARLDRLVDQGRAVKLPGPGVEPPRYVYNGPGAAGR